MSSVSLSSLQWWNAIPLQRAIMSEGCMRRLSASFTLRHIPVEKEFLCVEAWETKGRLITDACRNNSLVPRTWRIHWCCAGCMLACRSNISFVLALLRSKIPERSTDILSYEPKQGRWPTAAEWSKETSSNHWEGGSFLTFVLLMLTKVAKVGMLRIV